MSISQLCLGFPSKIYPNGSVVVRYKVGVYNEQRARESVSGKEKLVCVTGASGFVGSWLVKTLLQRGYYVNGTVRNLADTSKTGHLLALDGAQRLTLFEAELTENGSFDSAIEGVMGVFHTASPFRLTVEDPERDLIKPAVDGTLNVLGSVARTPSVERVVMTSSTAAVLCNNRPKGPDVVVDETWFSDPNFCRVNKMWYALSKTLAEEAAWKFANDNKINLVTINPSTILGRLLQPTLNESASLILKLINGATTYPNEVYGWVHVKNVVEAHILALESKDPKKRYCLVESVAHYLRIVALLHGLYPHVSFLDKCANDKPLMLTYKVSKEEAQKLGVRLFIPLEDALKDTVDSLIEKNFFTEL